MRVNYKILADTTAIPSEGEIEMTKEQFIAIGLTEELATKAAEESKKELDTYIPKSRFDEVNIAKKKAETDLKERDTQLENLKKSSGDSEALKVEIQKLQDENKTATAKYQADLKDMQLSSAIKLALSGKAQDENLVAGLFDKSKLILGDDGKITGLDEQLKGLQESKAFLFKQEEQTQTGFKTIIGGAGGQGSGTTTDAALAAAFGIPSEK